jgi:STE24 endopeptidase
MATSTLDSSTGAPVQDAGQPVSPTGNHDTPRSTWPADGTTAALLAGGLSVAVCVVARLPHRILDLTGIRSWSLALVVAVSVVAGARALARAPFTLRRSLHAGDRTALRRWAAGEVKTTAATVAGGVLASLPLYALLRSTPQWWLPAWLLFAGITLLWQLATPAVLRARHPAQGAGAPAASSPALVAQVQAVADKAGVDVGDVIVSGQAGARCGNAYVVGLGRTRRVVVERALAEWPPALVDQVVAHELGHWRLGHSARRLPLTLLAELAALWAAATALTFAPLLDWAGISGAGDPRSYPLLLVVGAVVAYPVRCLLAWRDRGQELAADRFALDLLDRPDDFVAMLQRAAADSGVPRTLPWWRYATAGHPPIDRRAAACRPEARHQKGS